MGRVNKLTKSVEASISAEYSAGATLDSISRKYHITRKTIYRALERTGTRRRQSRSEIHALYIKKGRDSLCWDCQRAASKPCDQCSWAKNFTPVEGWDATPTICDQHAYGNYGSSFFVRSCPEYIADEPRWWKP